MKGLGAGVVLLALGAACAPMKSAPEAGAAGAGGHEARSAVTTADSPFLDVRQVRVDPLGAGRRVTIVLTQEPDSIDDAMAGGTPQLVIDMTGPRPVEPRQIESFRFSDDLVSQVRVGSRRGKLRTVLDLGREPQGHAVRREGATVIVELGSTSDLAASPPRNGHSPEMVAAAPADTPWLGVRDIKVAPAGAGRRLVVLLTRPPDALKDFVLSDPPRLVVDLKGPQPEHAGGLTRYPVGDDVVSGVRVAWNNGALRVVLDLRAPAVTHAVRQEGSLLVADLGDTRTAAAEGGIMLASAVTFEPVAVDTGFDEPDGAGEVVPATAPAPAAAPEPPPAAEPAVEPPVPPAVEATVPAEPQIQLAAATVAASPPALTPEPTPAPRAREARLPRRESLRSDTVFTGQRISLDFKDADIQNVLRVLADVSGLNIIATDDVKGKVTLHLTDVPWDQALDLVLRSNRLEKTHEGNVVRISTVARLKEEREALRAAQEAELELEPLRVKYIRVNYARADEVLVDKVKGVLSERGSVTFDDRTNTVIVRDVPSGIEDATQLIRELDVQSPQVLIEANIVEATEDFARGLGVQWGYGFRAGPQTGNPTGSNFPGTVGLGGSGLNSGTPSPGTGTGAPRLPVPFLADFPVPGPFGFGPGAGSALDLALGSLDGVHSLSARLTALEEQGKGKVISRPRVITMNNVAATIQSLTILRVKLPGTGTVINTGTGGAAGSASNATEKINTGITLVVTPQISSDGFVLMNIYAKSSQPDFTRSVDDIPSEVSREANSNVLVPNGETVVLGGIFRNTADDRETGVPFLRGVPGLGWLFKRVLRNHHREELLVFLTPKIVATGTSGLPTAERLWEERRQDG
jgi:type IV pilus assembly protein PilQ